MADSTKSSAGSTSDRSKEQRRSMRVRIAMPVIVRGKIGPQPFEEQTQTVVVSAHGCTVRLATEIAHGQKVSVVNPKTAEELPCTVISLGQRDGKKREVGVEFTEPSPLFWRIVFPPDDWDPSERKRPSPTPPRSTPRR
ncbi:MAG: PilZ domain-containing protein [Acidobacteriia bacterium]|nr:PilZ domain-containing protein [Terriglobia bacterium]